MLSQEYCYLCTRTTLNRYKWHFFISRLWLPSTRCTTFLVLSRKHHFCTTQSQAVDSLYTHNTTWPSRFLDSQGRRRYCNLRGEYGLTWSTILSRKTWWSTYTLLTPAAFKPRGPLLPGFPMGPCGPGRLLCPRLPLLPEDPLRPGVLDDTHCSLLHTL